MSCVIGCKDILRHQRPEVRKGSCIICINIASSRIRYLLRCMNPELWKQRNSLFSTCNSEQSNIQAQSPQYDPLSHLQSPPSQHYTSVLITSELNHLASLVTDRESCHSRVLPLPSPTPSTQVARKYGPTKQFARSQLESPSPPQTCSIEVGH